MTVPGTCLLVTGTWYLVTVPGTCAATSYWYEGLQVVGPTNTEIWFYRDPGRSKPPRTVYYMYYW